MEIFLTETLILLGIIGGGGGGVRVAADTLGVAAIMEGWHGGDDDWCSRAMLKSEE